MASPREREDTIVPDTQIDEVGFKGPTSSSSGVISLIPVNAHPYPRMRYKSSSADHVNACNEVEGHRTVPNGKLKLGARRHPNVRGRIGPQYRGLQDAPQGNRRSFWLIQRT